MAPGDEELAVAELWSGGTLGVETRSEVDGLVLTAYFEAGALRREEWPAGRRMLGGVAAEVLSLERLVERDWLREYRRSAAPFALGSRFWVDPGEPGEAPGRAAPGARRLLRLPARRAFGTGSHESSVLVVELLESLDLTGRRVLDVGTGTGLLSFVSSALGAHSVTALEIDPIAALLARENQALNHTRFPVCAGAVEALAPRPLFDLALVNVIPERIQSSLPGIARRLETGAQAVFSGCLADRAPSYRSELAACGFEPVERRDRGEWCAFLTEVCA